jgi:hypothetical protein
MDESPEAFEILSDGLYPNKIKAVVRELSTNAVESHITRHKQLTGEQITQEVIDSLPQFEIHLPTTMEPHFSIRDFGTGLSHDDIMNMYTTYFRSTKRDTNDVGGCLGLGSKSPFAYSDNFSVVSVHKGRKTSYNLTIDNGYPTPSFFANEDGSPVSEETSEPDGLLITIPCKSSDEYEWENEAQIIYKYFRIKPKFIGKQVHIHSPEYLVEGNGWGIRERDHKGPRAIMGSIAYPISRTSIKCWDDTDKKDSSLESILRADIDLYFPLGVLKITPSREALGYKPSTQKNIKAKLTSVYDELKKQVSTSFDECQSLWQTRCLANELFYMGNAALRSVDNVFDVAAVKWNGKEIGGRDVNLRDFRGGVHRFYLKSYYSQEDKCHHQRDFTYLTANPEIAFIEADLNVGNFARARHAVKSGKYTEAVVLECNAGNGRRKALLDKIGILESDIVKASELERPPKRAKNSGGGFSSGKTGQLFKMTPRLGVHNKNDYWQEETVDLSEGGIYVEMTRWDARPDSLGGDLIEPSDVASGIIKLQKCTGKKLKVYGCRSQMAKEFVEADNWEDWWTYSQREGEKVFKTKNAKHAQIASVISELPEEQLFRDLLESVSLNRRVPSPMVDLLKDFKKMDESKEILENQGVSWSEIVALSKILNIKMPSLPERMNLKSRGESIFQEYPMVVAAYESAGRYYYGQSWKKNFLSSTNCKKMMGDYVKLVDDNRECQKGLTK